MASQDVKVVELPKDATTPAEVKSAVVQELNKGYHIEGIYQSSTGPTRHFWAIMNRKITQ